MGTLRPAKYYDDIYKDSAFGYQNHWSKSHYRRLWAKVVSLLNDIIGLKDEFRLLELGCGTGQFAEMLSEHSIKIKPIFHYRGVDFSSKAIELANERFGKSEIFEFLYEFIQGDCLIPETYKKLEIESADLIVAMEILEHTDDLKILSLLPSGKNILITVPDFDDPAHIRHFKTEESVRERYSNKIVIGTLLKFERWYILTGITK